MNRKYRKTIIAGNWKMNMTASQIKAFADELKAQIGKAKWCDTAVCVSFPLIPAALRTMRDGRVAVGAQNLSEHTSGAYTGEVSASQLADLGVKYVIVGHSERRQYFAESDATVNAKAKAALAAGMSPIICVGESLNQRESELTAEHIAYQVKAALAGLESGAVRRCVIAYEPIWAIGTGKTPTPEEAEEVCRGIRAVIRAKHGAKIARAVSVLYGGSMNSANAAALLAQPDIDGGLIGGASLKAEEFAKIVFAANQETL